MQKDLNNQFFHEGKQNNKDLTVIMSRLSGIKCSEVVLSERYFTNRIKFT